MAWRAKRKIKPGTTLLRECMGLSNG